MDNTNGFDRQRAELAAFLRPSLPSGVTPPAVPASTANDGVTPAPARSLPQLAPTISEFERIAALGYATRLIPIVPPDAPLSPRSTLALRIGRPGAKDPRGKAPGVLTADGWTGLPWVTQRTTPGDLARWTVMKAGVGLRLGDGLYGIDADTLDPALAKRAREILDEVIPGAHVARVGRAPKFLVLLRVAAAERVPYKLVEFGRGPDKRPERVEGLSAGRQAVVAGIHPGTRRPYEWQLAMPAIGDLVEATPQQIATFFDRVAREFPLASDVRTEGAGGDVSQSGLRGDAALLEAAMRRLPNTTKHFPTREDYRDIAYSVKAGIVDERHAFEVFAEWSDRWTDPPDGVGNVDGYAESMWRTLKAPFRIGASWLLDKVAEVTGEPVAANWFAPLDATAPTVWDARQSTTWLARQRLRSSS